jgi:DHA1 family multidrug resistance protein-like MFS transporter
MDRKAFFILVTSMFISMLGFGIVVPLLPIYAKELGATGLELGAIFAAFGIVHTIFLPIVGRFSDRIGRKIFLCVGLLSLTFSSLAFIWAKNAFQLILVRCLQGFATTMHLPIAQSYLGDITPKGEEGRWMGHFNAILFSGIGVGPLFGGILADFFGISTTFIVMAILTLVGLLATIIWLPDISRKTVAKSESTSFASLRKSAIMKGAFSFRMAVGFSTGSLMAFLPLLASQHLGLRTSLIGILLASRTPIALAQSITGGLADKYNRRALVVGGGMMTLALMALLPMATNFWTMLVMYSGAAAGVTIALPSATAFVVEEGRIYGMGATTAIFMMAMTIGNGVGPLLLGGVVELWEIESAFYAGGVLSFLGVAAFIWYTRNYSQT